MTYLVLVDSTHEDKPARVLDVLADEVLKKKYRDAWTHGPQQSEGFDWWTCTAQVRAGRHLPDIPVVSLRANVGAGGYDWAGAAEATIEGIQLELDADLVSRTPRSTQIEVKGSGHFIQRDRPEVVIEAIRQMVEGARRP